MFLRVCLVALLFATPVRAEIKSVPSSQAEVQLSYAPLVKKTAPAVVNVFTSKTVRTRNISPLFNDPFFRRFFGDAFRGAPQGGQKKRVQNSLGSGVIVSADGVVITNHHVIDGADDIKVVLHDRREFEAKVLGSDERTDIAILKLDTGGVSLPTLTLGDSDGLEVGDIVLAIGNPFGVGQTVTSGIVSALARTHVGITDYSFFIQTDAAINPGNSGGALIDMNGKLVGINSAIYSKGGGSNGIGFAIPANMVRSVLSGVSKTGKVVRPWFGASGQTVTQDLAANFNLARPTGVLIGEVYKGGPADLAGIRSGDIILSMDGHEVNDPQALRFRLATLALGDEAIFDVLRRGVETQVKIKAIAPPEDPPRRETRVNGYNPLDGAVVVNMSPAYNDEMGWDTMALGVAIEKIRRGSAANRLGFHPGDRLVGVNGNEIKTVTDLKRVLDKFSNYKGDWLIGIVRNGKRQELRFRG
ncbi:MAG: DegQ family serine endoprotease [Methylocystaceae bacterium]|nr:DegQ family serine endoprotease [Methylocystaceae bacterium]